MDGRQTRAFSFDEERLIKTTNSTQTRSLELNKVLKKQQDLKLRAPGLRPRSEFYQE